MGLFSEESFIGSVDASTPSLRAVIILRFPRRAVASGRARVHSVQNAKLCVLVRRRTSAGVTVCRIAKLYEIIFTDPS